MKKNELKAKISALHGELNDNGNEIPDSWKPWVGLIKLFLGIAKIFTPDDWDDKIDEILAAIKRWEESGSPA